MATLVRARSTRRHRSSRPFRALTAALAASLVTVLTLTLVPVATAEPRPADPAPVEPSTLSEAEAAWQQAEHEAGAAAEYLNGAREAKAQAEAALQQAEAALEQAEAGKKAAAQARAEAAAAVTAADAEVLELRDRADVLANASYGGTSLSSMSALLSAQSAEDYLDQASSIGMIAADNQRVLADSLAAQDVAAKAKKDAVAAEAAAKDTEIKAIEAKKQADAAAKDAEEKAKEAELKKAELDAAVADYRRLYEGLSLTEQARLRTIAEAANADESNALVEPVGDELGRQAAEWAIQQLDKPYIWAATGPSAFDCSGLTMGAWNHVGIGIPRVSYMQATLPEVPLDELQPGDLVTYYTPVTHVAIYVGYGMVVNAASESYGIVYVSVENGGDNPRGHRVPR